MKQWQYTAQYGTDLDHGHLHYADSSARFRIQFGCNGRVGCNGMGWMAIPPNVLAAEADEPLLLRSQFDSVVTEFAEPTHHSHPTTGGGYWRPDQLLVITHNPTPVSTAKRCANAIVHSEALAWPRSPVQHRSAFTSHAHAACPQQTDHQIQKRLTGQMMGRNHFIATISTSYLPSGTELTPHFRHMAKVTTPQRR
jgi:hypothetical protein